MRFGDQSARKQHNCSHCQKQELLTAQCKPLRNPGPMQPESRAEHEQGPGHRASGQSVQCPPSESGAEPSKHAAGHSAERSDPCQEQHCRHNVHREFQSAQRPMIRAFIGWSNSCAMPSVCPAAISALLCQQVSVISAARPDRDDTPAAEASRVRTRSPRGNIWPTATAMASDGGVGRPSV